VAEKMGRSVNAVRVMRKRLGIPNPGAYGSPRWSAKEDDLVRRLPPAETGGERAAPSGPSTPGGPCSG
jgi:hypothetical protein